MKEALVRLRRRFEFLKKEFPVDAPVTLYIRKTAICDKKRNLRYNGWCSFNEKRYYITINRDDDSPTQVDTLMHEWAHLVAGWTEHGRDHSKKWGKAYADIYDYMIDRDPLKD